MKNPAFWYVQSSYFQPPLVSWMVDKVWDYFRFGVLCIVYADSKLVPWGIKFPRDWSCHLGRFTRQRKAKERKMLIKFFPSNPLKKSYTNPYGMAAFIFKQRLLMTKQKYYCVLVLLWYQIGFKIEVNWEWAWIHLTPFAWNANSVNRNLSCF